VPRPLGTGYNANTSRKPGDSADILPHFATFLGIQIVAALILDGKPLAEQIQAEIVERVTELVAATGKKPKLAAVLVGDDPASQVYVRNKERACAKVGIESQLVRLPDSATQEEMMDLVHQLNRDDTVSGILVQLPLPGHLDPTPGVAPVEGQQAPQRRSRPCAGPTAVERRRER
jgi:phenylpyruvate tautomerase PptA (4-oxalocrotonate tautomerase family)